jgi:type I restriction enzyme S subunit
MNEVRALKDTQIDWIGKIPSHWDLKKIKYVFWERKENNNPIQTENLISLTIEKGVIPHSEKTGGGNKPKEDLTKYKLVYPGDIVLNSMNVIAGAVGISKYFGVVSPVYYMLIPVDENSTKEYFHHMFRTEPFQKSLYGLGNGILIRENEETGKLNTIRMRISMDKLGDQFIPVPPSNEQKLISQYLDKKSSQIDRLIEKIQNRVQLLREQRTSLIDHCVTKGLDPNSKMKNSGVEWIGEIPIDWKITRLKYQAKNGVQYGLNIESESYNESGVRFLRITDINSDGTLKENDGVYLDPSDVPSEFYLNHGDLLFSRSGGTVGKSTLIGEHDYPMSFAGYLVRFSFENYSLACFIKWITESGMYWRWIDLQIIQSTIQNVNGEKYSNFIFALPSLDEIEKINNHLLKKTRSIDRVIDLHEQKLKYLSEYRQSLISSIVTGKVQVTEEMI